MQFISPTPAWLASQGYAVVVLDVMGTGSSEGGWECFSDREVEGVTWVIDHWIPGQAWSDGKVGMYGTSYMALASYLAAGRRPRHLEVVYAQKSPTDVYRDVFFQGGSFNQEFIGVWAVGTILLSLLPGTQALTDPESAARALADHQIRIDIAVTDFPHLLPGLVPAETEILHDPAHPSRIILPVVTAESTRPDQWIQDPVAFFAGRTEWVDGE